MRDTRKSRREIPTKPVLFSVTGATREGKKSDSLRDYYLLTGPDGFEPSTSTLTEWHSAAELQAIIALHRSGFHRERLYGLPQSAVSDATP